MAWKNVPGFEKAKPSKNTEPVALRHEYLKINAEISRLNKRKKQIQKLLANSGISRLDEKWFEKSIYLYVLQLEQGKYYVGMTRNVEKRFKRHCTGKGATWTKKYKPISIVKTIDTKLTDEDEVAILENELTFETAIQYGLDNVRGGGYCQAYPKWPLRLLDELKI